jgi:hypothetical protein
MRTSLYSILCIVIRLGTIFLAFGMLTRVPMVIVAWKQGTAAAEIGLSLGVIAAVLLIALLLWIYPSVIARLVAGRNSREVFESPIGPAELQWIALSVLGIYFLMEAVIALSHYGVQWMLFATAFENSDDNRKQLISDMSYYVIQLIFGGALTLGARGLSGLLRRLRYGDVAHSAAADTAE